MHVLKRRSHENVQRARNFGQKDKIGWIETTKLLTGLCEGSKVCCSNKRWKEIEDNKVPGVHLRFRQVDAKKDH